MGKAPFLWVLLAAAVVGPGVLAIFKLLLYALIVFGVLALAIIFVAFACDDPVWGVHRRK